MKRSKCGSIFKWTPKQTRRHTKCSLPETLDLRDTLPVPYLGPTVTDWTTAAQTKSWLKRFVNATKIPHQFLSYPVSYFKMGMQDLWDMRSVKHSFRSNLPPSSKWYGPKAGSTVSVSHGDRSARRAKRTAMFDHTPPSGAPRKYQCPLQESHFNPLQVKCPYLGVLLNFPSKRCRQHAPCFY